MSGKDEPSRASAGGKLEVRPTGRPVSLRDVTLPEVSTLSRAQMNWQLIRRVARRVVRARVLVWHCALRSGGAPAAPALGAERPYRAAAARRGVAVRPASRSASQRNMPWRP